MVAPVAMIELDVRGDHGLDHTIRSFGRIGTGIVMGRILYFDFVPLAQRSKRSASQLRAVVANQHSGGAVYQEDLFFDAFGERFGCRRSHRKCQNILREIIGDDT
jgi:hypothetical protein